MVSPVREGHPCCAERVLRSTRTPCPGAPDCAHVCAHVCVCEPHACSPLGCLTHAGAVCRSALEDHPAEASLLSLQQRIATAASLQQRIATAAAAPAAPPAAAAQRSEGQAQRQGRSARTLSERELKDMRRGGNMNAQQVHMMNNLLSLLPSEMPQHALQKYGVGLGIDKRIPPFHEEFLKAGE